MEIFLNKLFSKIKRETKKGREGGRKRERKWDGKKEGQEGRKKEGEKQTGKQRKEGTRHLHSNFIASSLLLEHTHIQNMNLVS